MQNSAANSIETLSNHRIFYAHCSKHKLIAWQSISLACLVVQWELVEHSPQTASLLCRLHSSSGSNMVLASPGAYYVTETACPVPPIYYGTHIHPSFAAQDIICRHRLMVQVKGMTITIPILLHTADRSELRERRTALVMIRPVLDQSQGNDTMGTDTVNMAPLTDI